MEVIEAIKRRRSVRNYTDELVEKEVIKELIGLAAWAPSASNQQPWGFLMLEGRDYLKELSDKTKKGLMANIDNHPELQQYRKMLENESFNIFHNASTVVVIYGNTDTSWYKHDCSLAAQNFMLAAHDKGLGTCWIGFAHNTLNTVEFKQKHNIPEKYEVVAPLIIGYPAKGITSGPPRKNYPIFNA